MGDIKSFIEENYDQFIEYLDKIGYLHAAEDRADECLKELQQALKEGK